MMHRLISDAQISLIKEAVEQGMPGMDIYILDLIDRLCVAEEVIEFYSTPGNVIGTYQQYREKSEEEKGRFVPVGEKAEAYFRRCNRIRR